MAGSTIHPASDALDASLFCSLQESSNKSRERCLPMCRRFGLPVGLLV